MDTGEKYHTILQAEKFKPVYKKHKAEQMKRKLHDAELHAIQISIDECKIKLKSLEVEKLSCEKELRLNKRKLEKLGSYVGQCLHDYDNAEHRKCMLIDDHVIPSWYYKVYCKICGECISDPLS